MHLCSPRFLSSSTSMETARRSMSSSSSGSPPPMPWQASQATSECCNLPMSNRMVSRTRRSYQPYPVCVTLYPVPSSDHIATDPSDVFTISFYETTSGQVQGAQLTHENLTAGVAAVRALFPLSHTLTSLDTILSAHSLSSLWGRSILYTAIFENTSFATVPTSKVYYADDGKCRLFWVIRA